MFLVNFMNIVNIKQAIKEAKLDYDAGKQHDSVYCIKCLVFGCISGCNEGCVSNCLSGCNLTNCSQGCVTCSASECSLMCVTGCTMPTHGSLAILSI